MEKVQLTRKKRSDGLAIAQVRLPSWSQLPEEVDELPSFSLVLQVYQ